MRYFVATPLSLLISMAITFFMATLVSGPTQKPMFSDTENFIEFVRLSIPKTLQVRKREMPKEPETAKQPMVPQKTEMVSTEEALSSMPTMDIPSLDIPLAFGSGPGMAGFGRSGAKAKNRQLVPLVRIEPRYPRRAAIAGVEGWVVVKFDIGESGATENVSVAEAKPRRTFDRTAKGAVLKWKYKPQISDGKPVKVTGQMAKLIFELDR